MSDLNWNLRDILYEFKDSRLPVFVSIFLHKNTRNRSWPSNDLIADETGLSSAPISAAIGWMIEQHVVVLVPFDKRVGLELKLSNRKNIYQLTGVVLVDEEYYPYMNLTPEGWQSIAADLDDMGNSLLSKQLNDVDSLLSKCLDSKRKGIKDTPDSKDNKSNQKKRTPKPNPSVVFREQWQHYEVLGDALLLAFGLGFVPAANQTMSALESYLDVAIELTDASATVEQIPALYKYIKERANKENWSTFSVKTLARYYTDFLKSYRPAKVYDDPAMDLNIPQPIVPILVREAANHNG